MSVNYPQYWDRVRAHVARTACQWSCGFEARLLFENLVEHPEWQDRLMKLIPERLHALEPSDVAFIVVNNYFSQGVE